ncbi:uncharacterized protein TNCV_1001601 [Trichonephila clavipes]|nr:uncharacterized protein TNCV_1001601 [Trichonephila clavipes]
MVHVNFSHSEVTKTPVLAQPFQNVHTTPTGGVVTPIDLMCINPSTRLSGPLRVLPGPVSLGARLKRPMDKPALMEDVTVRKPKGRPTKRRKMLAENSKKRWQKSSKTVDEKNSNSMVLQRDTLSEPSTSFQPEASYIFTHKAVFSELLQKVPCKYCTNCTLVIKQHHSMGYSTKMELL